MVNYFRLLTLVALSFLVQGCFDGPGLFTQKDGDRHIALDGLTDSEGVTSALIGATMLSQTLNAGAEELDGVSVMFPPGALAIPSTISLESGAELASTALAMDLGLGSSLESVGTALVIQSTEPVDALVPFTLAIPAPAAGLALTDIVRHFTVVYRVTRHSEGGKTFNGVIPTFALRLQDGKILFETRYFGAYQLAFTTEELTEEISKETNQKVQTSREERRRPPIEWEWLEATTGENRARIRASLANFSDDYRCVLTVDQDKKTPWDYVCESGGTEFVTDKPDDYCKDRGAKPSHGYAQFSCRDADGRVAVSPWSKRFSLNQDRQEENAHKDVADVVALTVKRQSYFFVDLEWRLRDGTFNPAEFIIVATPGNHLPPAHCSLPSEHSHVISGPTFDYRADGEVRHYQGRLWLPDNASYQVRVCAKHFNDYVVAGKTLGVNTTVKPNYISHCQWSDQSCMLTFEHLGHLATLLESDQNAVIAFPNNLSLDADMTLTSASEKFLEFYSRQKLSLSGHEFTVMANIIAQAHSIDIDAGLYATGYGFQGGSAGSDGSGLFGAIKLGGKGDSGSYGKGGGSFGLGGGSDATGGNKIAPTQADVFLRSSKPFGGGGGGGELGDGGKGGGTIQLRAKTSLTFGDQANIRAKGEAGGSSGGGGGAGGTIWLRAPSIEPSSEMSITVEGGESPVGFAGGGGLIRIEVAEPDNLNLLMLKSNGGSSAGGSKGEIGLIQCLVDGSSYGFPPCNTMQ